MNERTQDFENSTIAYMTDAFCISMGALMGTSPATAYIESATGIAEGGKTGITAMVSGFCFFIAIFFAPIFSSIPSWATGGALFIAGSLMMRNTAEINWDYLGDAIPAFMTILIIPITYNIAYGLIAGILSMVVVKVVPALIYRLSGGRLAPAHFDTAEEWTIPEGGLAPLWMRRIANGKKPWLSEEEEETRLPVHQRGSTSKVGSEHDVDEKDVALSEKVRPVEPGTHM